MTTVPWLREIVTPIVERLRWFKSAPAVDELLTNYGSWFELDIGDYGWVRLHGVDEPQNGGKALVVELGPPDKNVILMSLKGEAPVMIFSQRFDIPECPGDMDAWTEKCGLFISGIVTGAILAHAHYDSR